jgi:predicted lipid-binding transport protein (Tim44 family)
MSIAARKPAQSRFRLGFALVLALLVALAPALAEARAGSGSSMGSRGSRTYQSNGAQPMQRSMTPEPSAPAPSYGQPGYASPAYGYGGSFSQRHPFMTGLLGGFIGAGIAGMLFGHSAWAADGGMGAGIGVLLQLLLIFGLIWLAVQFFRRGGFGGFGGMPQMGGMGGGQTYARSVGAMAAPATRNPVEVAVTDADYQAWSELLVNIQTAWSKGDLMAMRRFVTPEMLGYFNEQLSGNASRGLENRVEHVTLLKGDVEEAWDEGEFEYVTARLRWSATDYMVRQGTNTVVEGDPSRPQEVTEVWTFVRSRGGHWLLSAIQQV